MNETISNFLQSRIDAGDFPSAVYLVAEKGDVKFHDALGYAVVKPERIEAKLGTIYDVANLTKPLVTGLLCARSIQNGTLRTTDLLSEFRDEFKETNMGAATVQELAVHTSGVRAWAPMYLISKSLLSVPGAIANLPLESPLGKHVIYSDLNFIALGLVIEACRHGWRIDLAAHDEIFEPLQLTRTLFNPSVENWNQVSHLGGKRIIAASEKGNAYEKQTCLDRGFLRNDADFHRAGPGPVTLLDKEASSELGIRNPQSAIRNHLIWGEVHDGNAYFMGGVAGHAGLFSTAEEVFKLAQQFLPNHTTLLKPETCKLFTTNFTPGLNEDRSFAFQLASTEGSTAGQSMSPQAFGHNGFTGTSLWIDPVHERIFILLTNRTHNRRPPFVNINSVRRRFHDLAVSVLDKKISN